MQTANYRPIDFAQVGGHLDFSQQLSNFSGLGPAALSYNNMASMGMLPNMLESNRYAANTLQNEAMKYSLRLHDRRPAALARLVGGMFGGGVGAAQAQSFMRQSPFLQNVASNMIDNLGFAPSMGGSPVDLGYGALAATSSGGMSFGSSSYMPMRTQRLEAERLAKHLYNTHYTESGFARTDSVHGMNTRQIGDIMAVGAASGAFRGLDLSDIRQQADGTFKRTFNKDSLNEINTFVEDASGMMRELVDIFGDRSFAELADVGQKLTGMSIGGVGNVKQMTQRIKEIKRNATALGMDTKDIMGSMMEAAGVLQQFGFGEAFSRQVASSVDPQAYRLYTQQHAEMRRQGLVNRPAMDFTTYNRHYALDQAAMMHDEVGQISSALSIFGGRNLKGDARRQVMNLVESGDENSIMKAMRIYEQETGMDLGETIYEAGGIQNVVSNLASVEEQERLREANLNVLRRRNRETRRDLYARDADITNEQAGAMVNLAGEVGDENAARFLRDVAAGREIDVDQYNINDQIKASLLQQINTSFGGNADQISQAALTHETMSQIHAQGRSAIPLMHAGLGPGRDRQLARSRALQNLDAFGVSLDDEMMMSRGDSFLAGLLGDTGMSNEQMARTMHLRDNLNQEGVNKSAASITTRGLEIAAGLSAQGKSLNEFAATGEGKNLREFLGKTGIGVQFKNRAGDVTEQRLSVMDALQMSDYMTENEDGTMSFRDDLTDEELAKANALMARSGRSRSVSVSELESVVSGENRLEKLNRYSSQARIGIGEVDGESQFIVQQRSGEYGFDQYNDIVSRMRESQGEGYTMLGLLSEGLDLGGQSGLDNSQKQKLGELINQGMSGEEAMQTLGITDPRLLKHAKEIENRTRGRTSSWLGRVYRKNFRHIFEFGNDFSGKLGIGTQERLAVDDALFDLDLGGSANLKQLQKLMREEGLDPTTAAAKIASDKNLSGREAAEFTANTVSDLQQQFLKTRNIRSMLGDEDIARTLVSSDLGEDVRETLVNQTQLTGIENNETREEARELLKLFDQAREQFMGITQGGQNQTQDFIAFFNSLTSGDKALNVNIVNDHTTRR